MTPRARLRAVAGMVLADDDGRVLMMRRRGEDTWGFPGGGVEPGESWVAAAERECLEETGWRAQVERLLGVYSDPATQLHTYPNGDVRHFVGVVFLAKPVELLGTPDGEAAELRWVFGHEVPEPVFGPDVPVLRDLFPVRGAPVID